MNYKTKILQYLTSTQPKYYVLMQELINNTIFDKILNNNSIIENKNNEESFIEKLTYFIDFFYCHTPFTPFIITPKTYLHYKHYLDRNN